MSEPSVSTETPAETLRRAAEMMRAAANLATAGPYVVIPTGGHVEIFGRDHFWVAQAGCDETTQAHHDARYIAAMHPGVALAVAAWLQAEADAHDSGMAASNALAGYLEEAGAGEHHVQVAVSTLDQALAVARIFLREATP